MSGGLVGIKIKNQVAGAWFWPTKHGSIHFQTEGTPLRLSKLCLKLWGPVIEHGMRRGLVGAKKSKAELLELIFDRRNMGGLCFE